MKCASYSKRKLTMPTTPIIEEITQMTSEVYGALIDLLPQVSASARRPTFSEAEEIVSTNATHLFMARDPMTLAIVGALTLVVFRIPTGVRAWIEDVVVDESERGKGIGRALCQAAISCAITAGARTVDLTSRVSRDAAHRLYESIGFQVRDTSVYRYSSTQE